MLGRGYWVEREQTIFCCMLHTVVWCGVVWCGVVEARDHHVTGWAGAGEVRTTAATWVESH